MAPPRAAQPPGGPRRPTPRRRRAGRARRAVRPCVLTAEPRPGPVRRPRPERPPLGGARRGPQRPLPAARFGAAVGRTVLHRDLPRRGVGLASLRGALGGGVPGAGARHGGLVGQQPGRARRGRAAGAPGTDRDRGVRELLQLRRSTELLELRDDQQHPGRVPGVRPRCHPPGRNRSDPGAQRAQRRRDRSGDAPRRGGRTVLGPDPAPWPARDLGDPGRRRRGSAAVVGARRARRPDPGRGAARRGAARRGDRDGPGAVLRRRRVHRGVRHPLRDADLVAHRRRRCRAGGVRRLRGAAGVRAERKGLTGLLGEATTGTSSTGPRRTPPGGRTGLR